VSSLVCFPRHSQLNGGKEHKKETGENVFGLHRRERIIFFACFAQSIMFVCVFELSRAYFS